MAQPDEPSPGQSAEPAHRSPADTVASPASGPGEGTGSTEASSAPPPQEATSKEAAPTLVVGSRWTGVAPAPVGNGRRLLDDDSEPVRPPLDPTLELPPEERGAPEDRPPVDPWADHPVVATPLTIPYPEPPATRPAPPPAAPTAPPPRHDPPVTPLDGPPPGWRPPPGYVVVVRRRRRWPWVLLAMTLFTFVCCCGLPVYVAKPMWDQYPASAALPERIADLRLADDPESRRTAQRLKLETRAAHLVAESVFAGVYTTPAGKRVTVFGVTGFQLDPAAALKDEVARLTPAYGLSEVQSFDTGERGEHVSCATGQADGEGIVACTWADHGSLGTALFTRLSVEDSAALLAELRSAIITRG
ncbi:MAG TPA: hypothetical protein VIL54_02305 [Natronosporangium sp.]